MASFLDSLSVIAQKAAAQFGQVSRAQGGQLTSITNPDGMVSSFSGPSQGPTQVSGAGAPTQMGPGVPPTPYPLGPEGARQWPYRVGWNLPGLPGEGRVAYATLKDVSNTEWLTRKAIEV